MHVGLHQDDLAKQGLALTARDAIDSLGRPDILLVDLRSNSERAKHGMAPSGALHAPYPGHLRKLTARRACCAKVAAATGRRVVFFCAFGERSAMAVSAAKSARPRQHRPHRRRHRRLEARPGWPDHRPADRSTRFKFRDQHVERFRQHDAAAFGQPFRNHDASFAGG